MGVESGYTLWRTASVGGVIKKKAEANQGERGGGSRYGTTS